MRSMSRYKGLAGFTLVEVLVIAPLLILIVGAIVTVIINIGRSSMLQQGRVQLQYEVQSALDHMEQSIRTGLDLSGSTSNKLAIDSFATDKNPLDPKRLLIRRDDCTVAVTGLPSSEAARYVETFELSSDGKKLQRKTSIAGSGCQAGDTSVVWQKHGLVEDLISNTSSLVLSVEAAPGIDGGRGVSLEATRTVAGRDISYTGVMYARSLNIR